MKKKQKGDKIDGYSVHQILQDAWLNVIINEKTLYNPMEEIPDVCSHRPELYYSWLLTRPEYLGLAAKVLLNINLAPFQVVILQQMWTHKFPMVVASRGAGKTYLLAVYALLRALLIPNRKVVIVGSVFRQSKMVFNYIKTIYDNSPILKSIIKDEPHFSNDRCHLTLGTSKITGLPIGCLSRDTLITTSDGIREMGEYSETIYPDKIWSQSEFKDVGFFFDNGVYDCKKIKTNLGYEYTGTPNHKMKIVRDNKIIWCRTDEMKIGDHILIDISERWFNPSFEASDEQGYALGCMIGDGSYVRKERLQFTTIDKEFIPRLSCIGDFKEQKDNLHYFMCKSKIVKEWMDFWGLNFEYAKTKKLPNNLLSSSKSVVANCIAGIFDTDGHVFTSEAKGGISISINFTTISEKLAKQLQYVLLHFGIKSSLRSRKRNQILRGVKSNSQIVYELMISGPSVLKFYQEIPIKLERKKKVLEDTLALKTKFFSIKNDYIPVDKNLLLDIVLKKTVGDGFYQKDIKKKKTITKSYLEKFLVLCKKRNIDHENVAILEEFLDKGIFFVEITDIEDIKSVYTVDLNVPSNNTYTANGFISHNTGDKIRGERASEILSDEFASQSKEIFETVIAGFGAVSADPMNQVRLKASQVFANHLGIELEDDTDEYDGIGNQIILSGTAYYHFNHFAQYWEKWKQIIHSKGETKKLQSIFGDQEIDDSFNWKDYCVVRLPCDLLPPGFMDASQLARSRATLSSDIYALEFSAIFSKDSNGFFKASLLEKCTANEENDITHPSGRVVFEAKVKGDNGKEYVIGVDPASEQDRFAVVVIELHQDHRRIVHVWTTNSEEFKAKRKAGIIEENDFYGYTARKIRDLMILFPCVHLAIDSQGGGKAVYEALHDTTKLKEGEHPLWEIIEEGKNKDTDGEEGLHIVEMVNFASAEYTSFANHSMKKDFEDKILLFPRFNPAISAVAAAMNKISMREDSGESINGVRLYDSYEDAIEEIEELKKELSQIVITRTAMGRERWDTPDIKISGTEKGKMRKDRYSALVMANAAARKMSGPNYMPRYDVMGLMNKQEEGYGKDFIGPAWITNQLNDLYS
jgi:intein/homing endonuclease